MAGPRNLAPGSSGITASSGFSKAGSFGSSLASFSFEDADHALPFAHPSHPKNSSSFASSTAAYSDSEGSKHPHGIHKPYAGPDRYVKTTLTYASSMPYNRKGNKAGASNGSIGSNQSDRPLSFKSMAKGPDGSNRIVLAANDGKTHISSAGTNDRYTNPFFAFSITYRRDNISYTKHQ
ncbi:hypothetical protein QFC19_001932 [Naganishia cerealis]|uniref:Uncharacterized protein n=1 Tax=Naganishia cerealis TaxID=610337 RepID=A0ACC2WDG6_9TREE|nr:hypothetical protein QFC19_001932 [Naganishia cerealis]